MKPAASIGGSLLLTAVLLKVMNVFDRQVLQKRVYPGFMVHLGRLHFTYKVDGNTMLDLKTRCPWGQSTSLATDFGRSALKGRCKDFISGMCWWGCRPELPEV